MKFCTIVSNDCVYVADSNTNQKEYKQVLFSYTTTSLTYLSFRNNDDAPLTRILFLSRNEMLSIILKIKNSILP